MLSVGESFRAIVRAAFPKDEAARRSVELIPSTVDDLAVTLKALQEVYGDVALGRKSLGDLAEEFSAAALFLERLELQLLEARKACASADRTRRWAEEDAFERSDEPAQEMIPSPPAEATPPADPVGAMKKISSLFGG